MNCDSFSSNIYCHDRQTDGRTAVLVYNKQHRQQLPVKYSCTHTILVTCSWAVVTLVQVSADEITGTRPDTHVHRQASNKRTTAAIMFSLVKAYQHYYFSAPFTRDHSGFLGAFLFFFFSGGGGLFLKIIIETWRVHE